MNLWAIQQSECAKVLDLKYFAGEKDDCIWKILIFDKYCQDILSTLFRVGNLREMNITLHLPINSQREKVHSVKAIYFVQPNEENVSKIVDDLSRDIYDNVFINFASPISQDVFEKFGMKLGKFNCVHKVKQVTQHSLSFVSLGSDLFDLNLGHYNVYKKLKSPSSDKDELMGLIAKGLFSVCRTLKVFPRIHSSAGIAEGIIKMMENYFKEFMESDEFQEERDEKQFSTATLFILDRDLDLASVLMHAWQYAAMIHDLFEIKCNKVQTTIEKKKFEVELDPKTKFWEDNLHLPFPDVCQKVDEALVAWKAEFDNMSHKKVSEDASETSKNLEKALDSVTEMTEKKKMLDMHTNLAAQMLNEVKERSLDKYFEIETSMLFSKNLPPQDQTLMNTLLSTPGKTEAEYLDKIRLLAIYLQTQENLTSESVNKLIDLIEKSSGAVDNTTYLKALEFFKKKRVPKLYALS